MKDSKAGILAGLFVGGLCLLVAMGVWIFSSAMEAQAYNSVTGANVSTWDAMWIELRVQDGFKSH